jgi:hypothetical protein
MALFGKHEVIRHAHWDSLWEDDRIYEERVQRSKASNVQIEVYSTIMVKDEITNCISTLYRIGIAIKGF